MRILECYIAPSNPGPKESVIRVQHRFLFWTWESMWQGDILWRNIETGESAGLEMGLWLEEYANAQKFLARQGRNR